MLGGHCADAQHAHGDEDQQEQDGNDENWHTSPLTAFSNRPARQAVTTITARREPQTLSRALRERANQLPAQTQKGRCVSTALSQTLSCSCYAAVPSAAICPSNSARARRRISE
jgi:hypothetical protein